ncbi:TetR/AcrR family transcriptional regulator [Nocardioides oleivorans]|uniref:TetR/AcrR family transcriptional regulator n=1 Tax=Nocardioides oleivorans TaxID=273676 RepID=A0A4Q2S1I6_9ACTN|nr:TetR/AcrR family transcriptional regulator [Nocardioides oleivorans]RYB94179.1 TetR/AcrR family transcriptional regulator [Nocardioides oleivorans]
MTATDDDPGTQRDQRHRAIVDAARSLATEHGAHGFTVDRVAEVAGVSRRTVFNHFTGVDQLLVAVCEEVLTEVTTELLDGVDRLTADLPAGAEGHHRALDALGEAAREVDLAAAIVTINHVLGEPGPQDVRAAGISRSAFELVGSRLRERLLARAPGLDPLDLELTLCLLTNGLALIAGYWLQHHPSMTYDVPPGARTDWDVLLDRLLHRLRVGHAGATTTTPERPAPHG